MRFAGARMLCTVTKRRINVEVVYALPDEQYLIPLQVAQGISAGEAIKQSRILEKFPQIDLTRQKIGVFSRIIDLDTVLLDGDRVEIYRPLEISPKQARRLRAQRVRK
jgi:putative ubiquitin-RnfH superfamily antitoxin RatB of RatAB toxin-antitoxin module